MVAVYLTAGCAMVRMTAVTARMRRTALHQWLRVLANPMKSPANQITTASPKPGSAMAKPTVKMVATKMTVQALNVKYVTSAEP